MRYIHSVALILLLVFSATAQNRYTFEQIVNTKVFHGVDSLTNPWAGGLNYPVFNSIDLDFDGKEDLLAFDRNGFRLLPFLNEIINGDTVYRYHPEYSQYFPFSKTEGSFFLLRDFNCDGLKDIFYSDGLFLTVYENTSANGQLSFTIANNGLQIETLYPSSSSPSKLYISRADLPDINDVDGDGDIDILTFGNGGTRVEFHENVSTNCGLDFVQTDACWGYFQEDGFHRSVIKGACLGGNKKANPMHAGSSMLTWDLNNDLIPDLLLSNVSYNNLSALTNTGSLDSAFISAQDSMYPPQYPVDLFIFPAAYRAEASFDGVPDLLLSSYSNATSGSPDMASNHRGIWRYENTGTANQPNFIFKEDNFLQKDMIDAGSSAAPRLEDINGDGLIDLVVAIANRYVAPGFSNSLLYYYENTGTATKAEFTLQDTNFADLHQYNLGEEIAAAFGDLDGDNDLDLIVGTISGYFHYLENTGSATSPVYVLTTPIITNTDVGADASPELFDIDEDGDLDLFVGNEKGRIFWFENSSTTSPTFSLKTAFFGATDVSLLGNTGNAKPIFIKDSLGTTLFVGSYNRGVLQFDDVDTVSKLPTSVSDTFGNGALESQNSSETPFGINRRSGRNQFLVLASEMQAKGYMYGYIESLGFNITDKGGSLLTNGFTLKIKTTTQNVLNGFENNFPTPYPLENFIFSFGNGWNSVPLQYPFLWDGQSNLVIEICFRANFPGDNIRLKMSNTSFNSHVFGDITGFNTLSADGCAMPFLQASTKRPDFQINLSPGLIPVSASENPSLFSGFRTAADFADLDNDGYLDAVVGNMSGGLSLYSGKFFDVGQEEEIFTSVEDWLQVFPNPSQGSLRLSWDKSAHGPLTGMEVFNFSGQKVGDFTGLELENEISLSPSLKKGVYLLVIRNNSSQIIKKLILKTR
jgi:hypothetical protein